MDGDYASALIMASLFFSMAICRCVYWIGYWFGNKEIDRIRK